VGDGAGVFGTDDGAVLEPLQAAQSSRQPQIAARLDHRMPLQYTREIRPLERTSDDR
jgi:hypothetical protein